MSLGDILINGTNRNICSLFCLENRKCHVTDVNLCFSICEMQITTGRITVVQVTLITFILGTPTVPCEELSLPRLCQETASSALVLRTSCAHPA